MERMEELYKKDLNEPDYDNGVLSHPEPDILECKVQWALRSTAVNKASGCNEIPAELFKSLKDDAIKVLHSLCQMTQQWPHDWKRSTHISVPKKHSSKECANHQSLSSPMLGRSFMKTRNFQMSKLCLEKEEELEIKLPTFAGV